VPWRAAGRTSWRSRWKPSVLEGFKKAQAHTALADIHESIDELLHYRRHFIQA
jgi:oligoribonuclease